MNPQNAFYVWLSLTGALIALGLVRVSWQRRAEPGAIYFVTLMTAVAVWSFTTAGEYATPDQSLKMVWSKLSYLGVVSVAPSWFLFASGYSQRLEWLTSRRIILLSILPLITLGLAVTNEWHGWLWPSITRVNDASGDRLVYGHGLAIWIHATFAYALLFIGSIWLLRAAVHSNQLYRWQIVALIIGAVAPWVGNIFYLFDFYPWPGLDPTPLIFSLTGIILTYAVLRLQILDITPVARDTLIEEMQDGVVVLDARHRIVDINPAGCRMLDCRVANLIGQPLATALPKCVDAFTGDAKPGQPAELALAHAQFAEVHVAPLFDQRKQLTGRLVVLRDITERQKADQLLRSSNEYARSIIDSSLDMIVTVDNQRRIVEFNQAAEKTFGYQREEVIGKHIDILYANQVQSQVTHRSAVAGDTFVGEAANRRKNGEIFYSLVSTATMRNANGERIGIVGVSRDITDRKKIEQQLHESEERYRLVINNLGEGIAFADANEFFTFANPAMEHIFGVPPGGLMGRTLQEFTPPDQFEVIRAETRQRETGERSVYEVVIVRPDGERRTVVITAAPWFDHEGKFIGAFGLFRDVTLRKRAELAERDQRVLAEALRDTAMVLNSTLEIEQVLDRILANVGRVLPHDAANIMLINGDQLQIGGWRGYDQLGMAEKITQVHLTLEDVRGFREMQATGQPIVVPDTRADPTWINSPISSWVRSYAGAPIRLHDKTVGFINLDSTTPGFFRYEQAERLRAFADQAAIAIQNARLYQEIQQIAITDPLTGLYNRRGLLAIGNREVERCLRYARPLSAIFFDIDQFKIVNDTYGHGFGDKVLQVIANVCRRHLRTVDILGRHGGEEFLVLLPETPSAIAFQIADRTRVMVADTPIALEDNPAEHVRVTISLGVASLTSGIPDLAALINLADQAQYRAKQSGRNRVELANQESGDGVGT